MVGIDDYSCIFNIELIVLFELLGMFDVVLVIVEFGLC